MPNFDSAAGRMYYDMLMRMKSSSRGSEDDQPGLDAESLTAEEFANQSLLEMLVHAIRPTNGRKKGSNHHSTR